MTLKTLVFRPGLTLSLAVAGVALSLGACGSDPAGGTTTMTTTATSTTTAPVTGTDTTSTTAATPTTTSPAVTPTVEPAPSTTATSSSTSSATTSNTTSEAGPTGATSGAEDSSGGDDTGTAGASGASSAPADSSGSEDTGGAPLADDYDPKPEDFVCISDWEQISGFRIFNFLGQVEEAKAVANNPAGGIYPVGTVLQHLPTEAMVKRKAGFSPETKDWEFFLLTLAQDGTVTISERGPNISTAQGQTCPSCHSKAADAFDFVCNTWADHGGAGNCGFDFMQSFLNQQLASDTRCK